MALTHLSPVLFVASNYIFQVRHCIKCDVKHVDLKYCEMSLLTDYLITLLSMLLESCMLRTAEHVLFTGIYTICQ